MAQIIDGKALADQTLEDAKTATADFVERYGKSPCLAVVLVGDDPASAVYVRNKGRAAEKLGFESKQVTLPASTRADELKSVVTQLNADASVHGILVQLPLPDHIDDREIIELIVPEKDVDGFHPINVGRLGAGELEQALIPCTPAGSVLLAKQALGDNLSGKHVVIVGRSNIVGKPAAQLFLNENCTVTIAHSRTRDISALTASADIVVAAVGVPELLKADWFSPDATVIDVGINRVDAPEKGEGKTKLVGDVAFEQSAEKVAAITPVPGGVGPMTIAMLMRNTLTAAERIEAGKAGA